MNKKLTRLCLGILSTALLSSISSMKTVYAAENQEPINYIFEVEENGIIKYCIEPLDKVGTDTIVAPVYYGENTINTISLSEDEYGKITFTTFEDLKELASNTYSKQTMVYYVSNEPLVITEDLTIPNYLTIVFTEGQQIIVSENVNLTLVQNGSLSIRNSALTVSGNLTNTGSIFLLSSSTMTISESGSYTGSGRIIVYCTDEDNIADYIRGIDLDNCEKRYTSNSYSQYWTIRDLGALIKLGKPTDLIWGIEAGKEVPGTITWKPVTPDLGRYDIDIYKVGDKESRVHTGYSFGSSAIPEWRSIATFRINDLESGTYYFTIQSRGDQVTYAYSDLATSDTWTYMKPDEKLEASTNLSWDWPRFTWDGPEDDLCGGYYVNVYFAASEGEMPQQVDAIYWYSNYANHTISDRLVQRCGNGYYYFKVRALSADITAKCNGEWSELSKPYILSDLTQSVETELNSIIASATTAERARAAVQELDTEELKSAMLADQSNTGTVDKISELEELAGGAAAIDVDEEVPAFDLEKVSIIGANLNNAASESEPITLVINKPEKENIIPEAYSNALAVRFSMTLDNVEDTENLKVPVKITLPVPKTINPEFLVLLHYHAATNEVEELDPYVYYEGGQYYASFVLTSFSDFVMTQPAPEITFEDVEEGAYYEQAVKWAVERGITNGYGSDTIFNPEGTCTRGQIVTFLWRANGSPEPASLDNPFTDVLDTEYYYKAVLWAVENGITAGYGSDTIFNPDGACTRAQVATFMWRAAGKPDMSSAANPFTDLDAEGFYYDAVLWAVENGITNGYGSADTFCPDFTCTRGQIVTFLYRGMN